MHRRVTELTDAPIKFGLIPHDHWYQPKSIDEAKAKESRDKMVKNNVIYGGSVPCVYLRTCDRRKLMNDIDTGICADSTLG